MMWRACAFVVISFTAACGPATSESTPTESPSSPPPAIEVAGDIANPDTWLVAARDEGLLTQDVELQLEGPDPNGPPGQRRFVSRDDRGELGVSTPASVDITGLRVSTQSLLPFEDGVGALIEYEVAGVPDEATAYGVVIDVDHNGTGDYMLGMDNSTPAVLSHAEWIAELATGTVSVSRDRRTFGHEAFATYLEGWFPGEDAQFPTMLFANRQMPGERSLRFYFWAATVQDGRMFVDYAPNSDWINFEPTSEPEQ